VASNIRQAVPGGVMGLVPHYIDVVGRVALTPEQKAKAAAARQKVKEEVGLGPGRICFSFCPNSLCLIPQIQPIMLGLRPIMPSHTD